MNHYLFLSIIFIYFILLIKISISSISFIYPYSIKLSNENILVIHRYGICICNSFVTEIINNIIVFTESEQILTEAALSFGLFPAIKVSPSSVTLQDPVRIHRVD